MHPLAEEVAGGTHLARRLGERARLVARQSFTFERHVDRLQEIFRDAIAERCQDQSVLAGMS